MIVVATRGSSFPKAVQPGDVVRFVRQTGMRAGRTEWARLVTSVGKSVITFLRLRSSWCWEPNAAAGRVGGRSATVAYDLPMRLEILRRATPTTRDLAFKFREWVHGVIATDADWQRACDLAIDAIKCRCD